MAMACQCLPVSVMALAWLKHGILLQPGPFHGFAMAQYHDNTMHGGFHGMGHGMKRRAVKPHGIVMGIRGTPMVLP